MLPVIGVPLRYGKFDDGRAIVYISERLRRTLLEAGGYVFSISPVQDVDYIYTKGKDFKELTSEEKKIINYNLSKCDGLLFPGGIKFTPYDRYLLEQAIEKKIPVLGICLGMQLMSCYNENVYLEKNETYLNHNQEDDDKFTHKVKICKDSKLYEIIGKEEITVNSFHNYHVTNNGIYKVVAVSEDGLIEAIEYPGDFFNIGIQWHPEISYEFDEDSRKIIDAFIDASRIRKEKREQITENYFV